MSEQPDSLWSGSYLNAATSRMIEGQIPFPHPSSHSLSVSISRTTKGIPLVVVFICSMFHPQSVIICLNSPPRKRMQSGPLYPSLEKWTRVKGGTLFSHSASRDSFLAQPSHPSLPLPLPPNPPSSSFIWQLSIHLSFMSYYPSSCWPLSLLLSPFLCVLHRSSLFTPHGAGLSRDSPEHLCSWLITNKSEDDLSL